MENYSHVEDLYLHFIKKVQRDSDLIEYKGSLYHYTSSSGLMGILQSQRLWATEASYLNDAREIEYGLSVVKNDLGRVANDEQDEARRRILHKALSELESRDEEIYIACFSEVGDLLSQWKGYGDFGYGFSIEFDRRELLKKKRKASSFGITISKVIYGREEQFLFVKKHASEILDITERSLKQHPESAEAIEDSAIHVLSALLRYKSIWFKSEAFVEEREWRAVIQNPESSGLYTRQPVNFRVSNKVMIPYMEFDLGPSAQKSEWQLPISSIVAGACVNKARAEKSIALIYKNRSASPPLLRTSEIPLQ